MSNNNGDSEIDLVTRLVKDSVLNILKQHDCQIIPVMTIKSIPVIKLWLFRESNYESEPT